ncbi:efflux RND transporter periplasmic adaptor subunit [Patescibacteria group bacterium]|nr:efflux RND transporter periplasmic adaptor subunit [Patescibacteria group bacterium]
MTSFLPAVFQQALKRLAIGQLKTLLKTIKTMHKKILNIIKTKKKIIIISVIILIIAFFLFGNIFKKGDSALKTVKVVRGDIIQEVAETGSVEGAQEINLGFKTSGRIERMDIKVGDIVEKGSTLAKLEINQLYVQLNGAEASLAVAQTQYDKLIAGSTAEDIKVVESARNAAQDDLNKAYQDALNGLDDAHLKIYNAYNAVGTIQTSYFNAGDQEGTKVRDNKDVIGEALTIVKPYLDVAKSNSTNDNINSAVSKTIIGLTSTSNALKIIRETCESAAYYSKVSSADKTILDNHRSYIITSLTSVTDDQQAISSDKIAFQTAEDELAFKKAKPRQEDIDYYQAKVNEAEANVSLLQTQINDASLRSPIKAIVTKVDKKVGEIAQATELPISLISLDPFQVKVDIYEEDIVKIKNGNSVDIKVAAFSNETLTGKVITINPAGKLVDGVVYYEVTIAFDELKEGAKPGMTVDIVIKTAEKNNVLVVPKEAVQENGKITVLVLKDKKQEEIGIQIGLEGSDGKVEVISGLIEGEEIVIE